MLNLFDELING